MEKGRRFVSCATRKGMDESQKIRVDRGTGVNDPFRRNGNTGGFTPLLGSDGKPLLTLVGEMGGTSHGI